MIKDTLFNPVRFYRVCKKDILENWKTNMLRFIVMYAMLAVVFCFIYYKNSKGNNIPVAEIELSLVSFIIFGVLGCVYASGIMEGMATKEKRIAYLMLPATSFEKYLSRLMYSLVFYTFAFIVAFKLADFTRMGFLSIFLTPDSIQPASIHLHGIWRGGSGLLTEAGTPWFFLCQYLLAHSFFSLGGSVWYRKPLLKTVAALVVMSFIYIRVISAVYSWCFSGKEIYYSGIFSFDFIEGMEILSIVFLVMALFNWTLAYYRFKEAEVINRIL